jgi:uncharacterized protein (TIGR03435 family)
MRLISAALIVVCFFTSLDAQPAFEVASVRLSTGPNDGRYGSRRKSGGPGTNDPGRMIVENYSIATLIMGAYDVPFYLFSGPEWLSDIRLDITATIPPGTTKEQFLLMQQNLLATRLGLVVHREKREMQVYELMVAKGGSKLKAAAPPEEPADGPVKVKLDKDGFPVLLPGNTTSTSTGDRAWIQGSADTMDHLAGLLAIQLQAPVQDATGLSGKYDFTINWTPGNNRPDADPGMTLEGALPSQLGLMLRKTKGQVEILVVDHAEKTPTAN